MKNLSITIFGRYVRQTFLTCGFRLFFGSSPALKAYSGQKKVSISRLDVDQGLSKMSAFCD